MALISSLKSSLRDGRFHRLVQRRRESAQILEWKASGCPVPPPLPYKQQLIRNTASRFGCRTLVETGTFHGATIAASLYYFDAIHSVELSDEFYSAACRRFKRFPNVRLWHGDSAVEIARVLAEVSSPALFWLDAHYSGHGTARADVDSPIAQELQAIARHAVAGHVMLIDDARYFDGRNGYLSIDGCRDLVNDLWPTYQFAVQHDVIRITPN